MTSANLLSPDEKAAFEANGYHVLRSALTPEEVESYTGLCPTSLPPKRYRAPIKKR
jgi:hypothetical protein